MLADLDRTPGAPERLLVRSDLHGHDAALRALRWRADPAHRTPRAGRRRALRSRRPPGGSPDRPRGRRAPPAVADRSRRGRGLSRRGLRSPHTADRGSALRPRVCRRLTRRRARSPTSRTAPTASISICGSASCRVASTAACYADQAWFAPASGFSGDGRLVSVLRPGERPLDEDLVLVDVETGEARTVLAHPDEPALVGPPAWIDATTFYVASNVGRDRAAIVRYDLAEGATTPCPEPTSASTPRSSRAPTVRRWRDREPRRDECDAAR